MDPSTRPVAGVMLSLNNILGQHCRRTDCTMPLEPVTQSVNDVMLSLHNAWVNITRHRTVAYQSHNVGGAHLVAMRQPHNRADDITVSITVR